MRTEDACEGKKINKKVKVITIKYYNFCHIPNLLNLYVRFVKEIGWNLFTENLDMTSTSRKINKSLTNKQIIFLSWIDAMLTIQSNILVKAV